MNIGKPLCIVSCPIDTYSGYGSRSRDFVKSLISNKGDVWDIQILPQRWGGTPWGYIEDHEKEWGFLKPLLLQHPQLPKQPDVWMQITVPNEFQSIGKVNIGVTAGIETTICDPTWLEGLNRMNFNIVSSEHAKHVFETSNFDKQDDRTKQKIGHLKLEKPIEVLFEGVNRETYFRTKNLKNKELAKDLSEMIEEDFAYLFVGHWIQGAFGEDRKNIPLLIKTFFELFKNKKNAPALVLKTSFANSSNMDKHELLKRIDEIKAQVPAQIHPNIYLLIGDMHDSDLNDLYNHPKIKAMVSLTKGEGFGRPLLEFTTSGKPVITTRWSGQVDFLDEEFTPLIGGTLKHVHPSATVPNILIKESMWLDPDRKQTHFYLTDVFNNYKNYREGAKRQRYKTIQNFSLKDMTAELGRILQKNVPEFPKPVQLVLPKLSLPKLQKAQQ